MPHTPYRRPGVTVVQEFVGLTPALATFALPSVAIGPAYQLVDDDLLGTYSANLQVYAYASLSAGAQVDLDKLANDELFPATKKPVGVKLSDARIEIVAEVSTGVGVDDTLNDPTSGIFAKVLAGDLVVISEVTSVQVVAPQTDGVTTTADPDILTAGVAGQFSDLEVGDVVTVTGGTNTNTGTFNVVALIDDDNIKVDADINDGVGNSTDVAYSISGTRGDENQGEFRVKEVVDDNNLILESPLVDTDEAPLTYTIVREVSEIELTRVDALPANGFLAEASGITLPASLTFTDDNLDVWPIISAAEVLATYRGLRNDLAANVQEFANLTALQSTFGVDQIDPANPLAFGLSIMLQNTVTAVNGLGLDGNAVSDETLSYQAALDVLKKTEMYALVPLTQSPVIHQLFATHVDQLSLPAAKRERVSIINRLKIAQEVVADSKETVDTVSGARVIVNTQVDGVHDGSDLDNLNDTTTDAFLNVQPGDIVTIISGDDVTPGEFVVESKTDNNNIVLASDFASAGGGATNVNYFITRPDGVNAGGDKFYDREAQFLSDGVAAGHFLEITAADNSFALGRHKIVGVLSEKELEIEQIPGITSAVGGITYEVNRDLSKTEQATAIGEYSEAFGNRRVANLWPDILKAPVGQVVEDLPGFYGCCAIGALTTGLPTQQGFTNLAISGFLGLENSSGFFDDDQINLIASGGTMVLLQDGAEQPLFILHQLTTDRSAIKFQEYSVTKNVDFIAKFLRGVYVDMMGQWNIIDTTLDELRTRATAALTFLKDDTRLPRIGGVIRSGTLQSLEEDESQIDTVKMRFKLNIPIPLNNLDITIEV